MKPGTRVLIVEDDHSIARVVQLQLEHCGFSVRCCHDGISGLEEVSKFRPEVIVLDIMLPGLDGVGVLKRLRSQGIRVPIIMLTARDTPMDKIHSLELARIGSLHLILVGSPND
jgi:DNA-binding response OmpR family regulator